MAEPLNISIRLTDDGHGAAPHGAEDRGARIGRRATRAAVRGISNVGVAANAGLGAAAGALAPIGSQNVPQHVIGSATESLQQIGQAAAGNDFTAITAPFIIGAAQIAKSAQLSLDLLDQMTATYGRYSPDISRANAEILGMRTRFNIEQAREHGGELAELAKEKERFNIEFERLSTRLLIQAKPILMEGAESALGFLETFSMMLKQHPDAFSAEKWKQFEWLDPGGSLRRMFQMDWEEASEAQAKIKEKRKEKRKEEEMKKDDLADRMVGAMEKAVKAGMPAKDRNPVEEWMATHNHMTPGDIGIMSYVVDLTPQGKQQALIFRTPPGK